MRTKLIMFISFFAIYVNTEAQEINFKLSQKQWLEDFKFLKIKVEKTVPSYQITENKKAFDELYDTIASSEIRANKIEIVSTIQILLNTLNDEGCNVPLFQKGIAFKVLPIKTYWFNDGLFVLDAEEAYKDAIGQQIITINNTPIDEVFNKLKRLINADNDYYKQHLFQAYGLMPAFLEIIGIGYSDDKAKLSFSSGKDIEFTGVTIDDYAQLSRGLPNDELSSFTGIDYSGKNYWSEMLPNSKTLFIQMQRIENNRQGLSFSKFIDDIESLIDSKKTNKIVLDLRYGGGGNGFKLKRFTDLLRTSQEINKKGNLFVLTSKATRGTLLELASILKLNTKAILVGEPTAEGPNSVGDIKYITLPNSGIRVSLTHIFWPTSWKKDTNNTVWPDEQVVYNYSDKQNERDPWLELVYNYQNEKTLNPVPEHIKNNLVGTYKVENRKITIKNIDGKLFLTMNRKMKSFFEIHTELYYESEGELATDIDGVSILYRNSSSSNLELQAINWKGINLKVH